MMTIMMIVMVNSKSIMMACCVSEQVLVVLTVQQQRAREHGDYYELICDFTCTDTDGTSSRNRSLFLDYLASQQHAESIGAVS